MEEELIYNEAVDAIITAFDEIADVVKECTTAMEAQHSKEELAGSNLYLALISARFYAKIAKERMEDKLK